MNKPEIIPEVKKTIADEFTNYHGSKISIVEMSHRSKDYEAIHKKTQLQLREIMKIPAEFDIIWFQGERLIQYAAICLNLVNSKQKASYIISGHASLRAFEESKRFINSSIAYNFFEGHQIEGSKCPFQDIKNKQNLHNDNFQASFDPSKIVSNPGLLKIDPESSYLFLVDDDETSGVRFPDFPKSFLIS
jgi:phosphoserine aminotransferase